MDKDIFHNFDFTLLDSPDFKEDSVREELILPILKNLGYAAHGENKIIRSKSLQHPVVTIGSKQTPLTNFPDYLFEVKGKYAWVLDAKNPDENLKTGKNVEQTYFYAIHPEIRVELYALCNGKEFILFHISDSKALLYFHLSEINKHYAELEKYLSPNAFQKTQLKFEEAKSQAEFDYLSIKPLGEIKTVRKRAARRHFGVHGYFTKQSWDVVQAYIRNFTRPKDVVLDPFGGSGITVVEALMTGRKGIHIDLNPLSILLTQGLIAPIKNDVFQEVFENLCEEFTKTCPKTDEEISEALIRYKFPTGDKLPKGSDVPTVELLFNSTQKIHLAHLKKLIFEVKDKNIRDSLLLAFSSTITRSNLTYHWSSQGETGDASVFRYYRYRVAPDPAIYDILDSFKIKVKSLYAAKREMQSVINDNIVKDAQIIRGTATNLDFIEAERIDYIYTDPPYGAKIPYLDLSIMWNAWLDLEVTEEDYRLEAIEGGEHKKTKDDYSNLIAESIKEMYRVLKFDRWMSFVFQHQDPAYWHLIVDTAEKAGFEYAGAVKQNNGQTSFKKRQNPFTVLSGQLIINFKKVRNPKSIMKAEIGADITDLIIQSIEGIIAANNGATIEDINNELVIRGLELGFLDVLGKKYQDITPFLSANFDYHTHTETYHIKKNTKFKAHIPIELRVKYYVVSMLRRLAREGTYPHFDDIVLEIMPLLRNGVTPDDQTIRSVLEEIAERVGEECWKLRESGQGKLFDLV